ncbi:MAG: EI24 domain-containing protein [Geminicoccaceae bacterium]
MINDLIKTVRQLGDPAIRGVALRSILISVALFASLTFLVSWLLNDLAVTGYSWLDGTIEALAGVGVVILSILAFPFVATSVLGLFLEAVVDAVERKHYPDLPMAKGGGLVGGVLSSIRFLAVALALNLLALPLYLIPGANLIVFLSLNGYLLGREYFELVGQRRLRRDAVDRLRRENRGPLLLAGAVIAACFAVPILNLVAPILGAGFMTHRYYEITSSEIQP